MVSYLLHHIRLALPPVIGLAVLVFILTLGGLIVEVVRAPAVPSTAVRTLGDGVDEFSALFSPATRPLSNWLDQHGVVALPIALAASFFSALFALRELARWVRGPRDLSSAIRHLFHRAGNAAGKIQPVAWGVVHDACTERAVPFAIVTALDTRGSVRATTVADVRGRYGFPVPLVHAAEFSIARVEVQKSGYYARTVVPQERVALTATRPTDVGVAGAGERYVSAAAFWGSVVAVPLACLATPFDALSIAMIVMLGGSFAVRALGITPSRS